MVNFPPNLPPRRSLVQTEYILRAFVRLSNCDEEITSHPLYVEFHPHIDPSIAIKSSPNEKRTTIVKDENNGKVLGEATLFCKNENGTIFGSNCQLSLILLIRQSEPKYLPRKAKIEVCEIHKSQSRQQCFIISNETILLPPEILKPHQECTIPLRIQMLREADSRRGATGLPTLNIGELKVDYCIRVRIPIQHSRFKPSTMTKMVVVDCPIVVGNVKPKEHGSMTRKVPRLVVNAEGEGTWDSQSTSSRDLSHVRKNIVEWSEFCEIPRFLVGGHVDEDDIL